MKAPGTVFDIECNGFNPDRIHCLSVMAKKGPRTTTKHSNYRSFCSKNILVGHNIIRFDLPILKRIAKADSNESRVVDTLALSWYLYPERSSHGLGDWGEEFGIPKPPVYDWDGEHPSVYKERCEEDVKINQKLWEKQWKYLLKLYGSEEAAWRLIDYLTFKMECARDQEEYGWMVDVGRCVSLREELSKERDIKVGGLIEHMPQQPVWGSVVYPAKPYKKDGSKSAAFHKYLMLEHDPHVVLQADQSLKYIKSYKPPNPNSHQQVKDWLYSLGWKPETFKYVRDKETGDVRKIEQVRKDSDEGKVLCDSVLRLDSPGIPILEGLTVLTHRLTVIDGFLRDEVDGVLKARVSGLTNTLRFKHKELVNLPGVDKPYGKDIRGCLICPEGYELGGTDMCSLEDTTKRHYMYSYDPDYVEEMSQEGYDPHVSLAVFAGAMKEGETNGAIRKIYKAVNYASVYGAGGATVGRAAGVSTDRGNKLVEAYWEKNWSVKAIADDCIVKTVMKQKWLFNPVSELWYSLRYEKDRFSTLNQGTGVWCFDVWVRNCRDGGPPIIAQFHDEICVKLKIGNRERLTTQQRLAMVKTNEELNLNVTLDIDIQFGESYAAVH